MATPVTLTLVFQGLIAFVPGTSNNAPDLTAYLIDSSRITGRRCFMKHFPTIRFVTATCDQGCKPIPKCDKGPSVDVCECQLNHDRISIGTTVPRVTPGSIKHDPPHQMPWDGEGSAPEYVVNMNRLGATLDTAQLDLAKVAATMRFAYDTLSAHNFAHVKGFAKRFVFKQVHTLGMTSTRQAAATLLLANTTVESGPVTLTLDGQTPRRFALTDPEILIQNEPQPDGLPPCVLDNCSEEEIGYDFVAYYSLAQGGLASAELNLPHGDKNEKKMKICDPPFDPYTSRLESPPHYINACKCPEGQAQRRANVTEGNSDPCIVLADITSRPICPMAAFVQ